MTAALALWSHALAALLFAALALAERRRWREGRRAFVAALLATALWALATAGIDARDLSTRLVESARDLAWLGFTFALVRRARAGGWALASVFAIVALVMLTGAGLAVADAAIDGARAGAAVRAAWLLFRMMAAAGALVLVRHLHAAATPERGGLRLIALALGLMWATDLLVFSVAYAGGGWPPAFAAARGFPMIVVALLMAAAAQRRDSWTLALSRPAAWRALALVALGSYLGLIAGLARLAGAIGGEQARALQAAIVIGGATALLTLASTSRLGPWAKVKLAKHLFRHRYDYRTEWQRFTETLGGGGGRLEQRLIRAVANLLDAPAGLLLTESASEAWRWELAIDPLDGALAAHLLATGRIVELDAARAGLAPGDAAVLPASLLACPEAWAFVPLIHGDALAGAVVLARPPVPRPLDWEDFDLLRMAGRQAASYLAEDRAGRALAEAQRFDEFHRRFAFILHDLKNLVSQQQLVARNAERHADNPHFRADMVATLKDSADRMTGLLARLSQHEPGPAEPLGPVDCAALIARTARTRRAQHPVEARADGPCWALAHPQRLEQVIGHLVQNAIEASATGAPVMLRASAHQGRVLIEVADRGVGMSAAYIRDQLFRPFASSKPGGFGIGAFEARQLVQAMGGNLSVESREGEGTRFRIDLPVAAALEAAA